MNRWVAVGTLSAFLGVALGAFGAHALANRLSERELAIFHTGTQYQMYHALALIGLGIYVAREPSDAANFAGWAFTLGTVIFSGSLYALALSGVRMLGAITPVGGVLFLIGWLAFFKAALK